MDVWLAINLDNAAKAVAVLREFGFDVPGLSPDLFLQPNKVIRMGVPPFRIEVLTSIDGVDFQACYARRVVDTLDGIEISVISLTDLKANKQASGRGKDLVDLEHLP
jgi:hypothetical protein